MDVITDHDRRAVPGQRADAPTGDGRHDRPRGPVDSVIAAARLAWPALLAYVAVRAVGLLTLLVASRARGKSLLTLLATRSDGEHYLGIAQHGYDTAERLQSNMAFFPLFPGLVAAGEPVLPVGHGATAVALAGVAALAAAWGLFAIGDHLYGRNAGVALAVLWGVLPHAVVETMAYSEGLFTAVAAWSLYALLRQRWLAAAALCVLAGLTRPTASALIAVVCLAALLAAVRGSGGWRAWLALVVAPAGWLGYLAWVAARTGRPDGWFHIQDAGWGTSFDGGRYTIRTTGQILTTETRLGWYVVALTLLVAVALFALGVLDRQPWQLLLFSALMLVTTVGSAGYLQSKARFLLPAFALLLPVARALGRAGWPRVTVIVAGLAVVSAYYGSYLMLIWKYSP